jgi:hypothetical protein
MGGLDTRDLAPESTKVQFLRQQRLSITIAHTLGGFWVTLERKLLGFWCFNSSGVLF